MIPPPTTVEARPLFTVIHVTDSHFRQQGKRGDDQLRIFVDEVNAERHCPLPDYVIHTGDIINGYCDPAVAEADMATAAVLLRRLRCPCLATCHNHDTHGEDRHGARFRHHFGQPFVQRIVRDGWWLGIYSGAVDAPEIYGPGTGGPESPLGREGVAAELRRHADHHRVIFTHATPVTPRGPTVICDPDDRPPPATCFNYCLQEPDATPWHRLLADAGVIAQYGGHCHCNSRRGRDGVQYITTSALQNFPGEVRLLCFFPDRIEHHLLPISGGRDCWTRFRNLRDADHATHQIYYAGNEDERDFILPVGSPATLRPSGKE